MQEIKRAFNSECNLFIGTSYGRKSTKIHTIVNRLGNPISFLMSGGQIHDSKIAISLLETIDIHGSCIISSIRF